MRHLYFSLAMLLAVCFAASARQINENEAMLKAAAFSQKAVASRLMSTSRSSAMTLAYTQKSATSTASNCFYVFNRGTADGYIIVSADDRTDAILGYTDSGSFDYASLPDNARWWFSEYQRQIQYIIDHPNFKNRVVPKSLPTSVAPLCKSLWNQGNPFNDNCPTYIEHGTGKTMHCAAGCGATSVSQLMYYHKWPVTGTGSNSYTSSSTYGSDTLTYNLSADFSKSTYDWANMTDRYNSSSTTAQNAAVAKLMSDVGIGCCTDYSTLSTTKTNNIANALINHFGYDKSLSDIPHNYFSVSEMDALIQEELNSKRPVYYGGLGRSGGHAFILDGYNSDGYYHVNWGWGGSCNGYFLISVLSPAIVGIGGGAGGFNYSQIALIHIMKPTPGFHYLYNLIFDSISPVNTTVPLGGIIPIKIKDIVNGEFKSFNGVISLVTRDSKGNVLDVQSISDKFTLGSIPPDDAINQLFTLNYKVPTTLSDGTYSMMVEARADGDTIWQPMRGLIGAINHFNVTVSGSSATVVNSVYGTSISASLKSISPNLHKDRRSNIVATVSNSGGDYHGAVTLAVFDANHNLVQTDAVIAEIPAGQSVSLSFVPSIKAPAGNASFVFLDHNKDSIGSASVTVLPTPAAPSLSLADSISFPDKNNVDPQDIKLSIKINNAGGIYFDKITVKYYDENKNFLNSYASYYSFDQNETKAVTFNDGNSLCVPGTKCTLSVYAQDDTGALYMIPPVDLNSIEFTIKANVPSAIGSVGTSASSIFPNPASDAVTVRNANSITGISVYSITGALVLNKAISGDSSVTLNVASLPAGSYLVRVITAAGTTVQRFIKR